MADQIQEPQQGQQQTIKDIIKSEYINCIQNVPHFVKKYCWIQHPQRGRVIFNLYNFQEKVVTLFQNPTNKYTIINKCRQLGISTLVASYALWLMLFHKDKNILVIATKQETAKNMITKVQFMYENLPTWLKLQAIENNKLSLKLSNGSQIKAVSAAGDSGRSEAVSLLIIDEAAFIDEIDEIFPSAQQTLASGGQCVVISTPKGVGNWFHNTFTQAELGENGFVAVKLPWYLHPEKDQKWRDEQDKIIGKKMAAQENDCNFNTSGDTIIDSEILQWYKDTTIKDPIEKRGETKDYWIWEYPDYSKNYLITADVARGDDRDYSTFHVIEIDGFKQVAEYRCKTPTRDFGRLLVTVGHEWNDALLAVENANIGWDVVCTLIEAQYPNLYYSPKSLGDMTPDSYISQYDSDKVVPGFTNSTRSRPLIISKLKEAITDKGFTIQSRRLITEMETFIWENGKAQALKGYNDDLAMAAAIACYIREVSYRFDQYNQNMSKMTVSNIVRTQASNTIMTSRGSQDPWQIKLGNENHDLRWLL